MSSSPANDVGLMYRIFGRVKEQQSIDKKLASDDQLVLAKKYKTLIGIRVVSYFNDDIPL